MGSSPIPTSRYEDVIVEETLPPPGLTFETGRSLGERDREEDEDDRLPPTPYLDLNLSRIPAFVETYVRH